MLQIKGEELGEREVGGKGNRVTTKEDVPLAPQARSFPGRPKKAVMSSALWLWAAQVPSGET